MSVSSIARSCLIATFLLFTTSTLAATAPDNHAPVADAGPGRTAVVGEVITLDASGTYDRDGDRLNVHWVLRAPRGSGARLSDTRSLRPHFTVDLLGDYVAELSVADEKQNSSSDTVTVSTRNVAPVAIVDGVATGTVGQAIELDGSASFDFNNDPLGFRWSIVDAPEASRAILGESRSAAPTFIADVAGSYRIGLTVNDGEFSSNSAYILINTNRLPPAADAGPDRRTFTGTPLRLNSASAQHAMYKHRWHLLYAPEGSTTQLDSPDSAKPFFTADRPGTYLIQLVTLDGDHQSKPDTLVITAHEPPASVIAQAQRGGSDVDNDGVPDDIDNCAEEPNPTQLDTNGDGFGNACDADLDNDGLITNFGDLVIWADAFNSNPATPNWNPDADFNGDNAVNFLDLFIFQSYFLTAPGPIVNSFINPLGGTWHDPANWSLGVVPNTTHSARIDIGSDVLVEYSTGSSAIETLRSTTEMSFSGGSLTINEVMQVDAPVTFSGDGTISGADILASASPDPWLVTTFEDFTLANVTLGADITVDPGGQLFITDDLTLTDGATITLASDNNFTYLSFIGASGLTSLFDGDGEVVFGGTATVDNRNVIEVYNSGDGLIIGPNITIRSGTTGGVIDHRFVNGPITVQGTVIADQSGRQVTIDAAPLTVEGSLEATGSGLLDVFFRGAGGAITSSGSLAASTDGEIQLRGDWISDGAMSVTDATLDIGNTLTADWENNGSIVLSNATLELGGSYTVADIGNVTGTGTTILDGSLDNTAMTLDAGTDLPGTMVVPGDDGIIVGGSVIGTPLTVPEFISFTLDNVTLGADIVIDRGASLFVNDDLTMTGGATITLASDNNFTYLRFRAISGTTSTVSGDGEIVFGGTTTVDNRNSVESYNSGQTLVIGAGITLRSDTAGGTLDHRFNNGAITVQGAVQSSLAGRTILVDAVPLTIEGSLTATDGGIVDAFFRGAGGTIAATGMLSATTGGELQLRGDWVNNGTISITDSTLDLGNTLTADWSNNGTITLDNATLELGGSFTTADLGTVTGTGTVIIDGVLDNSGMTLDVGVDLPGTTVVLGGGGSIVGGSVVNAPLVLPNFTTFTFDNLTLGADVTINPGGQLFINDDLMLSGGATITLASDNNFTYLRFRPVSGTTSTLGGEGEVVFGGTTTVDNRNSIEAYDSTEGLIIGPNVTVRTDTAGGTLDHRFNNGPIIIQGTVTADLANRTVTLDAVPLTIEGSLEVSNDSRIDAFFRGAGGNIASGATLAANSGGELELRGDWVNDGTITATDATLDFGNTLTADWQNSGSITLSNATLELGGSYTLSDIGTITGTGTVTLDGSFDLTGNTIDVGSDLPGTTVQFGNNGIIVNGTIVGTPLLLPAFTTYTLENVTLGADVTIDPGGQLFINDDLTLSGGASITLASDNNFTYLRFRAVSGTTSTVDGTGEIVFGGTTTVDNRNAIEAYDSTEALVIGPNVTVRTGTTGGTLDHRFNNGPITIQGPVVADQAGRTVVLDALPLTIEGDLQASNASVIDASFRGAGGSITSGATLSAVGGSELQLDGSWISDGTITATDSVLDFGNTATDTWDNNGTVALNNATLELGGMFTAADIGTASGTGTTVINGSLNNVGLTLDASADLPGSTVTLGDDGSVIGGTIVNGPLTVQGFTTFTLDNVTLATDLTIDPGGQLFVNDDLSLSGGTTVTMASDNNFTYLRFVGVADSSTTLSGSGEIVFGGTTTVDNRNSIEVYNGSDSLVVGPGITIRSDTSGGTLDHRFNNGAITVQGDVISDLAGRTISIGALPLNIEGALQAGAGGVINFTSDYVVSSLATFDVDIGGTTVADYGRFTAPARTANLDGTLNINIVNGFSPSLGETFPILTFATANGSFATENGTGLGGGLSFDVLYNAADVTLEVIN